MIDLSEIYPLSTFQRNTKKHLTRLKKSGKAEVLTVNGRAEIVVQNAQAYQKLLEAADLADSVRILRQRLDVANRGEKGIPAKQLMSSIRERLGIEE